MSFFNSFLSLIFLFSFSSFAVNDIDMHEEGQRTVSLYETGLHEIDALCGPNIANLTEKKRPFVSDDRKEFYDLVVNFMGKYIWLLREEVLYQGFDPTSSLDQEPNKSNELYQQVKVNFHYKDEAGKGIVVIENSAHPSFVTRGGDDVLAYWSEYFRQKNLCFINDMWAHLLPEKGIKATRDFYVALQRLALVLANDVNLIYTSKNPPEKLDVLLRDMVEIDLNLSDKPNIGVKEKQIEDLSLRLFNWSTGYLSISEIQRQ